MTIGIDAKTKQPFVYDPMGKPDYVSGPDAKKYLATKVGIDTGAAYAGDNGVQQQDITMTLPMTFLNRKQTALAGK